MRMSAEQVVGPKTQGDAARPGGVLAWRAGRPGCLEGAAVAGYESRGCGRSGRALTSRARWRSGLHGAAGGTRAGRPSAGVGNERCVDAPLGNGATGDARPRCASASRTSRGRPSRRKRRFWRSWPERDLSELDVLVVTRLRKCVWPPAEGAARLGAVEVAGGVEAGGGRGHAQAGAVRLLAGAAVAVGGGELARRAREMFTAIRLGLPLAAAPVSDDDAHPLLIARGCSSAHAARQPLAALGPLRGKRVIARLAGRKAPRQAGVR